MGRIEEREELNAKGRKSTQRRKEEKKNAEERLSNKFNGLYFFLLCAFATFSSFAFNSSSRRLKDDLCNDRMKKETIKFVS